MNTTSKLVIPAGLFKGLTWDEAWYLSEMLYGASWRTDGQVAGDLASLSDELVNEVDKLSRLL